MKPTLKATALLCLLTGACLVAYSATTPPNAVTINSAEIRAQPALKSPLLVSLNAQTPLVIGERQGAWYKANVNGKTGWIRMLTVRLTGQVAHSGSSGLAELAAATKGAKSTTGTGIRGLTAQQLQNASENSAELAKLDNYRVDKQEAAAYARSAGIIPTKPAVQNKE